MPKLSDLFERRSWFQRFSRLHSWAIRGVQLAIFMAAAVAAFLLRFEFTIPQRYREHLAMGVCVWALAKIGVFQLLHLDRGWWRYASVHDFVRLAMGNLLGSALATAALIAFGPPGFPRSLYFLDLLLCFVLTAGIRMAVRVTFEVSRAQTRGGVNKRTLIYGAGDAGVSLLREIRNNSALAYDVVGFIDDSPEKAGIYVQRVQVLGGGEKLPEIGAERAAEMVLIAMPSATGAQMTAILKHCHDAGVAFKTVPGLGEVIESGGLAAQIRDVAVEDLLGRNPVSLDESEIRAKIENQVVAVTGAAGSIGSELCRQMARFRPAAIVGYECGETALFYLEREMREKFPGVVFHPEIGDIRNPQRLADVFTHHRPSILFHAAAYKHVPMMEAHAFEAVENNILGTWNVAAAAAQCGIRDFVMISSDKAVRPTNIMGATKRVAELIIHALQGRGVDYVSVRFGNVLGSNGSVIPIFKQQIAARKPLTITHPEMRRYFMTIPEAAQLVIQASTMGKGGEIFVLDMGEPVRIVDLAQSLILLSGLRPGEDIPIEFTGPRPGEKLYEELAHFNEEVRPTYHPKIQIFGNGGGAAIDPGATIEEFRRLCAARDYAGVILRLKELAPDYNPSAHVLGRIAGPVQPKAQAAAAGR